MHPYAQTNLQLFNQLRCEGYSHTDLSLVRDAYELAMVFYSSRFLPSGRPFLAHGVRTASILASLHLSSPVVAAGLLHNVYETGDFGDGRRGISTAKRQKIMRVLGREVEQYLAKFPISYWESRTMKLARTHPDQLAPIDRTVVLILLADHLEHLLDLDVLYYVPAERRYYLNNSRIGAEIAEQLGVSGLAAELKEAFRETEFAELPVAIPAEKTRDRSFVVVPNSCRKRCSLVLRSALVDGLHRLPSQLLRKIKLLFANQPTSSRITRDHR